MVLLALITPLLGTAGTAFFTLICAVGAYLYFKIKKSQSFWEKQGVVHVKPKFLLGSMQIIRSKSFAQSIKDLYDAYPDQRYCGTYQFLLPILVVRDPNLIKEMTVKSFDHFVNHRSITTVETDSLWGRNLIESRDERWRDLRATLSPSFTSSKMRIIYNLMDECAQQFVQHFKDVTDDLVEVEMKDALSRYTNDVIASAAFGLKFDSLKNRTNDFYMMGKNVSDISGLRILRFVIRSVSPQLAQLLKIKIFPEYLESYFSTIIKNNVRVREQEHIVRPDMLHLLLEAQKGRQQQEEEVQVSEGFSSVAESEIHKNRRKQELTLDDITSQAFVFFLAGFETVSNLLSFAFYELAVNQEVQARLREEIDSVVGKVTYETLLHLKYLDMVVSEALRKWPPAFTTNREVNKVFTVQPEKPGEKSLTLNPGQVCWLPIFGIHRDPTYYPDPERFDPERFSEENKHQINPWMYIPFGAGPRNCIGSRFALLETKLLIFRVLKDFEVVPVNKTPIPMVLDKRKFNLTAEGGMWLGLRKLNNKLN